MRACIRACLPCGDIGKHMLLPHLLLEHTYLMWHFAERIITCRQFTGVILTSLLPVCAAQRNNAALYTVVVA